MMRWRTMMGCAAWLLLIAAACARRPAWNLVQPPEVPNSAYPRGYQLLIDAEMKEWHSVGTFDSETASCETARKQNTDDSIDHAHEVSGADAKFDLPVRRAVHARCVVRR
jgi:hypothetical protein